MDNYDKGADTGCGAQIAKIGAMIALVFAGVLRFGDDIFRGLKSTTKIPKVSRYVDDVDVGQLLSRANDGRGVYNAFTAESPEIQKLIAEKKNEQMDQFLKDRRLLISAFGEDSKIRFDYDFGFMVHQNIAQARKKILPVQLRDSAAFHSHITLFPFYKKMMLNRAQSEAINSLFRTELKPTPEFYKKILYAEDREDSVLIFSVNTPVKITSINDVLNQFNVNEFTSIIYNGSHTSEVTKQAKKKEMNVLDLTQFLKDTVTIELEK